MNGTDGRVALAERTEASAPHAGAAASAQRVGAVQEKAEKPETTGEIVIEEINIDGMCGVY
jgi:mycofactocin precursor